MPSLDALDMLFAPVPGMPTTLPPEFWKRLLTPKLLKDLDEALQANGYSDLADGQYAKWKRNSRDEYWESVDEILRRHLGKSDAIGDEGEDLGQYMTALLNRLERRLADIKAKTLLPLYTKELRIAVFKWFSLLAPAFYAVSSPS